MSGGERRYKIRWMWGLGGIWANAGGISGAHLVCQLVQEIPAKLETYKVIFIFRWVFTSPEHERVHVLAHLREEEPISCTGPLWQLLWAGLVWYLYLFALTTPMISSSVDCQSQPAETELPYFVLLLCAVRGYQYISYIFIEWDNFPLFHFAFPPFSPIFQHQKVGWIIENPCDFERSHPNLMLGDGPCQRLHPSHLDDLSISFYLYIN